MMCSPRGPMLMKYEVIPMTMTALLHCSTRVSSNKGRVSPSESPMVSSGRVDWSALSNFEELSKSCRVSGSWLVEAAALFKRPPSLVRLKLSAGRCRKERNSVGRPQPDLYTTNGLLATLDRNHIHITPVMSTGRSDASGIPVYLQSEYSSFRS